MIEPHSTVQIEVQFPSYRCTWLKLFIWWFSVDVIADYFYNLFQVLYNPRVVGQHTNCFVVTVQDNSIAPVTVTVSANTIGEMAFLTVYYGLRITLNCMFLSLSSRGGNSPVMITWGPESRAEICL